MAKCCICGREVDTGTEFFFGGTRPSVMCNECEQKSTEEYFTRREETKKKMRKRGLKV